MTQSVRRRLLVFLVVAVLGMTYGAIQYVDLPRLVGIGRFNATVEMRDALGLYQNGVVTLRGVQVGRIDTVTLTPTGAAAEVQIDNSSQIPLDSAVQLRSTSAVGEQYINFEPRGRGGPVLAEGAVVPAEKVALPVDTAGLLSRVNGLVETVPRDKLATTVDALYGAFNGTGQPLGRLIDDTSLLVSEADANLDATRRLIADADPVLATQQRVGPAVRSFVPNLAGFTDQLVRSDADIRGSLEHAPPFLDEIGRLVTDLRPTLPTLLANLTSVGQVVRVYLPNVAQTVTFLQSTNNALLGGVVSSPLAPFVPRIDFTAVVNDPPPCTTGFVQNRRSPSDVSPALPATTAYCKEPKNSPIAVRGGRNDACPPLSRLPNARGISASDCGNVFQSPQESAAATAAAVQTQMEVAARAPVSAVADGDTSPRPNTNPDGNDASSASAPLVPVDPGTGVSLPPGATAPQIFGNQLPNQVPGWAGFLLNPLNIPNP